MNKQEIIKKIEETFIKKDGKVRLGIINGIINEIDFFRKENKIYYCYHTGSGRNTRISEIHHEHYINMFHINYEKDNDAPRGGALGNFFIVEETYYHLLFYIMEKYEYSGDNVKLKSIYKKSRYFKTYRKTKIIKKLIENFIEFEKRQEKITDLAINYILSGEMTYSFKNTLRLKRGHIDSGALNFKIKRHGQQFEKELDIWNNNFKRIYEDFTGKKLPAYGHYGDFDTLKSWAKYYKRKKTAIKLIKQADNKLQVA